MRNKALIFVLIGAVFFGLIAAVSVSRFLTSTRAGSQNTIVVAKVEIPLGAKIIPEQLSTVQVPREATPEGTFDTVDKVVSRIAVTRIAAREPVTNFRLAVDGTTGGLSAIVPEGYRAMTVRVDDESGLSGFLKPGAVVDVLVVMAPPGNGDPISKIVLQNIKVLASGENLDEPKDGREVKSVRTITLQVTPEQGEKLALASSDGRLRLALRNSIDQGDEQTPGANKRTLLTGERAMILPEPGSLKSDQQPKPAPAAAPRRAPARASLIPIVKINNIPPTTSAPPAPRLSVEVFEGPKKRTIDFP